MQRSDFYYDLPDELIAQTPLVDRASSRLMAIKDGNISHKYFHNIIDYFEEGDCLVLNNTKVIPARLIGKRKKSGAGAELLLLKRIDENRWESLVKPGKRCKTGDEIVFGDGILSAFIEEVLDDGNRIVRFEFSGIFEEVLDKLGEMPLPPYIKEKLSDKNRYQTVYAKYDGSAAAPTAGLHFTPELLNKIRDKGIKIAEVTLHVGLGTFRPVKEDNILNHHMHEEYYEISKEAADIINETKKNGKKVICVGTTSCRTVESAADENGYLRETKANTSIFIYPGYKFKVLDGLITNFHLPESTLIMLVCALAGYNITMNAYKEAVDNKYRFFSFGDAMLII